MPALRLSHKLFLASALMIGVVLSLAWWSLLTTGRLATENRTIIHRALPAVRLEVSVLDVTGRVVRRLASGVGPAGLRSLAWNGRDGRGNAVSAGTYFVKMTTQSGTTTTKRLVLIR